MIFLYWNKKIFLQKRISRVRYYTYTQTGHSPPSSTCPTETHVAVGNRPVVCAAVGCWGQEHVLSSMLAAWVGTCLKEQRGGKTTMDNFDTRKECVCFWRINLFRPCLCVSGLHRHWGGSQSCYDKSSAEEPGTWWLHPRDSPSIVWTYKAHRHTQSITFGYIQVTGIFSLTETSALGSSLGLSSSPTFLSSSADFPWGLFSDGRKGTQ